MRLVLVVAVQLAIENWKSAIGSLATALPPGSRLRATGYRPDPRPPAPGYGLPATAVPAVEPPVEPYFVF